jgi:hypothetical protein
LKSKKASITQQKVNMIVALNDLCLLEDTLPSITVVAVKEAVADIIRSKTTILFKDREPTLKRQDTILRKVKELRLNLNLNEDFSLPAIQYYHSAKTKGGAYYYSAYVNQHET